MFKLRRLYHERVWEVPLPQSLLACWIWSLFTLYHMVVSSYPLNRVSGSRRTLHIRDGRQLTLVPAYLLNKDWIATPLSSSLLRERHYLSTSQLQISSSLEKTPLQPTQATIYRQHCTGHSSVAPVLMPLSVRTR